MRGSGSLDAGVRASSTASAMIVPRTMRGNSSAPKPRVMPSGICSNQNVAANSAAAIAMTAAAATRLDDVTSARPSASSVCLPSTMNWSSCAFQGPEPVTLSSAWPELSR